MPWRYLPKAFSPIIAGLSSLDRPQELRAEGTAAWELLLSIALHGLILVTLAWIVAGRPIVPRPVRSIEVELIDQQVYEDEFELPPETAVTPLSVPTPATRPADASPATVDGMTEATDLFASRVLSDPANSQVRDTLPLLENTERMIQLCTIEGLEQLHLTRPSPFPDSIAPSAFAPTTLTGLTIDAPGAAFRAARKWYGLRFSCTVDPNLSGVAAFRYGIGEAIPEAQWEAHDLIAEDEDE